MPALFPPSSNALFRALLVLGAITAIGVPLGLMVWVRTPLVTGQHRAPAQPVEFSHQIHVKGLRIDCRYCHSSVERTASAGMPSTQTCLPCHSRAWRGGPLFSPVRRSLASGRPIPWIRVNRLPDFVFFNHAVHVNKGVGCETCHGRVDLMRRVQQAAPLTMGWCLDCHRNPEPQLRPVSEMTTMGYRPPESHRGHSAQAVGSYQVQRLLTCTACHR